MATFYELNEPVATIRYERGTPGKENDMPKVVSCNWLPDGVYSVYATPHTEAVRMSEAWQPIETAPKDGTPVLVYHNRMVIEAWYSNKWGRFVQSETGGHNGIKPEHWMPLPPPPVEQATAARLGVKWGDV